MDKKTKLLLENIREVLKNNNYVCIDKLNIIEGIMTTYEDSTKK